MAEQTSYPAKFVGLASGIGYGRALVPFALDADGNVWRYDEAWDSPNLSWRLVADDRDSTLSRGLYERQAASSQVVGGEKR